MTSSVFSILFFIFLFSSINGNEVQISTQDIDALNDISEEQPEHENQKWMINHLTADQVDFNLQANSALNIGIKNFGTISATVDPGATTIEIKGLTVNIELRLSKIAEGKLSFSWKSCKMSAEDASLKSPGIIGKLKNSIVKIARPLLKYVGCYGLKKFGLPRLNEMLRTTDMNFLLSRDLQMSIANLDMLFKAKI
ncbi:hypothetical protein EXN66_Car016355 [Channa argus]|uniref:Lipid-binding serum glycoprotein N-terminal domain-containing protein n=1 Tax=Channa argus TaxID=215402 RepID=A0A6G1QDW2_CHAAH|nr:hypothetical protein EXN66_Car016355 [Channa argus]